MFHAARFMIVARCVPHAMCCIFMLHAAIYCILHAADESKSEGKSFSALRPGVIQSIQASSSRSGPFALRAGLLPT